MTTPTWPDLSDAQRDRIRRGFREDVVPDAMEEVEDGTAVDLNAEWQEYVGRELAKLEGKWPSEAELSHSGEAE